MYFTDISEKPRTIGGKTVEQIKKMYDQVTTGNRYDYKEASNHNLLMMQRQVTARELPDIEAEFVAQNHVGCCLHYGMTLFKRLRDAGYEAYIAISMEENPITGQKTDNHVSVLYVVDGQQFIADVVETVKTGESERFMRISVNDFCRDNGMIWVYDPYGEHGEVLFFEGFLGHPTQIFRPED